MNEDTCQGCTCGDELLDQTAELIEGEASLEKALDTAESVLQGAIAGLVAQAYKRGQEEAHLAHTLQEQARAAEDRLVQEIGQKLDGERQQQRERESYYRGFNAGLMAVLVLIQGHTLGGSKVITVERI
jgi:hypothetical protein